MKSILYYILITILLAYTVREGLYIGIRKNSSGEYDKLNTIFLKHNNYTTLIAGSSRAEVHYNPLIIDSITHQNTYNIGLEGALMPMIYAGLQAYLENSEPPENLILNIDYFYEIEKTEEGEKVFRFPRYFPYLVNKKLYNQLNLLDNRFHYFKWIPFYSMPYFNENYLNHSLKGYLNFLPSTQRKYYNGYMPLPFSNEDIDTINYHISTPHLQPIIYNSLDSIIDLCKSRNIQLFFVFSPIYHKDSKQIQNNDSLLNSFISIADREHIKYFDYSRISISNDKRLFTDSRHLNSKGSYLFSKTFAFDIKPFLKDRK